MTRPTTLLLALTLATPALADGYEPVRDKDRFLTLIAGKELQLPLWNIRLDVRPDGTITGSALGWDVTGTWSWQDGYFCREMDWSGMAIDYNCQLVEARGADRLRFTVDRGEGETASFRLR